MLVILQVYPSFLPNEAQIDLEWPISPDSQLFPSFATKASHFRRNLKNFDSWRGVHWQIFWVFQLFWIIAHWSSSKWSTMANFATEVVWISSKCVILVKCQQKLKYLSRILTDLHWTFRTGLIFLSWSKWVQGVLCYDQNWWKLISQWNLDWSSPNL